MDDVKPEARLARPGRTSRRTFLWGMGGASALLFGLGEHDGVEQIDPDQMVAGRTLSFTFDIVRPDDALVLKIHLYNMQLIGPIGAAGPRLTKDNDSLPSYLVAEFSDQSVGEEAVSLDDQATTPTYHFNTPFDLNGYRAHAFDAVQPTRLAFVITGDLNPSLEAGNGRSGLLDWTQFQPSLSAGIQAGGAWTGPTELETSIGAPFGIALSPAVQNSWLHSTGTVPDEKSGITEIWHTRLASQLPRTQPPAYAEYPVGTPAVTGIFSNGFDTVNDTAAIPSDTDNIQVPMDVHQRAGVVVQTSDYHDFGVSILPVDVHRLMLSSNGAWLDLHGAWPARSITDLVGWSQRSTHGRDQEVVVSEVGYLLPFGHRVTLIERSVRRFESSPTGSPVANLRKIKYLVIRKQDRYFDPSADPFIPNSGRGFPFTRVRLNVTTTPNLDINNASAFGGGSEVAGAGWCLTNGGAPYLFDVTAWDLENNKHNFSMPMLFITGLAGTDANTVNQPVSDDVSGQDGSAEVIRDAYNSYGDSGVAAGTSFVTAQLNGQPVALAASNTSGDTTVRIGAMTFGVNSVAYQQDNYFFNNDQPRIYPFIKSATARIPAVQTVSPGSASTISYFQTYIDYGFAAANNPGEVLLNVGGQSLNFNSGGNGTHPGVITPNMSVSGLSRSRGPVGGTSADLVKYATTQTFKPADFFSSAKLLGGLDLASIIASGTDLSGSPLINALRNYPLVGGVPDLTQPPTLTTTITWSPSLQDSSASNPVFMPHPDAALNLTATIVAAPNGKPPTTDVTGELRNFTIQLFGDTAFLILDFNEFSFHSRNGAKPTVKPDIANVSFAGALSFVNALEQFLPSGPGGNGISVTPTQVVAKTSIAIPSVSFGVFSLTNLSFNAEIDVPFTGDPARVRFSFCTRESPFLLAVLIFGGGGFVGLALGTDGMELLEASLEFGAHIGIDIGIASGSIEVMAGVYLAIAPGTVAHSQSTELTGFVKAHGELNLAVVAVSITFYLSLTYLEQNGAKSVWGEVDVSLDVRVLIVSVTVHFSVRKEFSGGGDPTFSDMYTPDQWSDYALAFA